MAKFNSLFSFSKTEAKNSLEFSKLKIKKSGFKLLQVENLNQETTLNHGKLLIITSRKTGKAHDRNLIRRRIKEAFYKNKLYQKPIVSIIIVYSSALKLDYKDIEEFLIKNI